MTDETKQIMERWERPEPPADLAARIIAQAQGQRQAANTNRPLAKLALVASLMLAAFVAWPQQNSTKPEPAPVQQADTMKDISVLAGIDLDDNDGDDEFDFLAEGYEL